MIFQGSKSRIAKDIVPIIQKYIDDYGIDCYSEPFVGGANIIDKIICRNKYGSDINEYLIKLLQYAQNHPDLPIAPEDCSFEHYADVRSSYNKHDGRYSDEYIALIGYAASYAGRFFDGGYGRDKTGKRNIYKERIANFKEQTPNLKDIEFDCFDYTEMVPCRFSGELFYLDPPYRDTKQYAKQNIDYDYFYDWCRQLAKDNIVIISEYWMPDDFKCIWTKERKVMQKSDRVTADIATEKLFIKGFKDEL